MMPNNQWNAARQDDNNSDENEPPSTVVISTTTTKTLNNNNKTMPLRERIDNNSGNVIVEMDTSSTSASNENEQRAPRIILSPHTKRTVPASEEYDKARLINDDQQQNDNSNTTPKRRSKLKKPSSSSFVEKSNSVRANFNTGANQNNSSKFYQPEAAEAAAAARHERLVPVSGASMTATAAQRTNNNTQTTALASAPHLIHQQQRQSLWERTKKLPAVAVADNNENYDNNARIDDRGQIALPSTNNKTTTYEYEYMDVQKRKRSPMQLKSELEARKRNFEWRRQIKTSSSSSASHHHQKQRDKQRADGRGRGGARHHSLDHLSIPLSSLTSSSSSTSSNSSENDGDDARVANNTAKAAAKFLAERQRARSRSPAAQRRRRQRKERTASQNIDSFSTVSRNDNNNTNTTASNSVTPRSASLLSVRDMPSAATSSSIFFEQQKQSLDDIFSNLVATVDAKSRQQQQQRPNPPPQTKQHSETTASAQHLRRVDDELERQLEELQKLQQTDSVPAAPATANISGQPVPAIIVSTPAAINLLTSENSKGATQFDQRNFPTSKISNAANDKAFSVASPVGSSSIVKRFIPIPPAKSGVLMSFPPPPTSPKPSSSQSFIAEANRKLNSVSTTSVSSASPMPWQTNNIANNNPAAKQMQNDEWLSRQTAAAVIPTPSSSSNAGSIIVTKTQVKPQQHPHITQQVQQPSATSSRLMSMSITGPTPIFTAQPNLQWNSPEQQEMNRRKSVEINAVDPNVPGDTNKSPTGQNVNFMRKLFEKFTPNKLHGHTKTETKPEQEKNDKVKPQTRHASPVTAHLNKILMLDGSLPCPQSQTVADTSAPTSSEQTGFATKRVEPLRVKQINTAQFSRIPVLSPSFSKRSSILVGPTPTPQQYAPVNVANDQSPMLPDLPPTNINFPRPSSPSPVRENNRRPTSLNLSSSQRSSQTASPDSPVPDSVTQLASSSPDIIIRRPGSADSLQQKFDELDNLCQSIASEQSQRQQQLQQYSSSASMKMNSPLPPKSNATQAQHVSPAPPTRHIAQIVRALNKQSNVPLTVPETSSIRRSQSTHVVVRTAQPADSTIPWTSAAKMRPMSTDFSPPTQPHFVPNTNTNRLSTFQAPITAFSTPQPVAHFHEEDNSSIQFANLSSTPSPAVLITPQQQFVQPQQQQQLPHLHYSKNPAHQNYNNNFDYSNNSCRTEPRSFASNFPQEPPTLFMTNYQIAPPSTATPTDENNKNDVVHKAWPIRADLNSPSSQHLPPAQLTGMSNNGCENIFSSRASIPTPVITVNKSNINGRRMRQNNPRPTAGTTMRVTFPRAETQVQFDDNFTRWLVQSQTKPNSGTVQRIVDGAAAMQATQRDDNFVQAQRNNSNIPAPRSRRSAQNVTWPPTSSSTNIPLDLHAVSDVAGSTRRTRPTNLHYDTNQSREPTMLEAEVSLHTPSLRADDGWKSSATSLASNPSRTTSLVTLHPADNLYYVPATRESSYYHSPTSAHQAYPVYKMTTTIAPQPSYTSKIALPSQNYRSAMKPSPSYPVEYRQSRISAAPPVPSAHISTAYLPHRSTTTNATYGSVHKLTPTSFAVREPTYQRLSDFKSTRQPQQSSAYVPIAKPSISSHSFAVGNGNYSSVKPSSSYAAPTSASIVYPYRAPYNNAATNNNYASSRRISTPAYATTVNVFSPTTPSRYGSSVTNHGSYSVRPPSRYGAAQNSRNVPYSTSSYSTPHTTWTTPTSRQFATLL